MGPYDKEQEQPLDNSNKPENYIDSKVKQQGDKSKQNAVNESPEGNGGEIYAQTNPLSNGTNQATIKVIRNGRNHIEKMDLDVKKAKWTVIFEKNGRFNQFCDINHHDREMTLDSNHTFCQRYLDYVRNNGQNSSKQVLYILFAIFDDDSLRKIGHTLVEKLNDIIFFRGER
ncbi:hypothetical protein PAE9249_05346 [Paenibacillus sp. CECT 9249]|nr:hypothetical protein PAE9249_05346 [Paenibacillus sp. CECT 9249]